MIKVTITTHMDEIVLKSFNNEFYSIDAKSIYAFFKHGKKEVIGKYMIDKED